MAYIGNSPQTQGFTPAIDYFSGNGSTVTFTLCRPLVSTAQVIAVIENVPQNPSTAFSVSGNSITFTSAPPSGSNNIWVEYTSLITQYNAISQDPSVIGDITASGGYLSTGDFGNTYTDGTIVDYVTGNARITTGPADGLTIYNGGTASRTALMAIDSSGNVGIGTTSPTGKTTINYNANTAYNTGLSVYNANSGSSAVTAFQLTNDAGNRAGAYLTSSTCAFYGGANTFNLGTVESIPFTFLTGNSERMRIESNGDVAIGNTGGKNAGLAVKGTSKPAYWGETTTSVDWMYVLANTGGSSGTAVYVMPCRFGSTQTFGGGVYWTGSVMQYTGTSDARLKENIVDAGSGLEKLANVKVRSFDWKESGSHVDFGVIAQELEEVAPEAVAAGKDNEDGTIQTPYAVDTSVLVPAMIKAIQEQQAIIEDLKARIETLEAK